MWNSSQLPLNWLGTNESYLVWLRYYKIPCSLYFWNKNKQNNKYYENKLTRHEYIPFSPIPSFHVMGLWWISGSVANSGGLVLYPQDSSALDPFRFRLGLFLSPILVSGHQDCPVQQIQMIFGALYECICTTMKKSNNWEIKMNLLHLP